jgi:diadenosine tetraphosphate (Ap4A) HIT family hydrolase
VKQEVRGYRNFIHAINRDHFLLVPKRHVANFFEMAPRRQVAVLQLRRKAQALVLAEHQPEGYNIEVSIGQADSSRECKCMFS